MRDGCMHPQQTRDPVARVRKSPLPMSRDGIRSQKAGGKPMNISDFLRGNKFTVGGFFK